MVTLPSEGKRKHIPGLQRHVQQVVEHIRGCHLCRCKAIPRAQTRGGAKPRLSMDADSPAPLFSALQPRFSSKDCTAERLPCICNGKHRPRQAVQPVVSQSTLPVYETALPGQFKAVSASASKSERPFQGKEQEKHTWESSREELDHCSQPDA